MKPEVKDILNLFIKIKESLSINDYGEYVAGEWDFPSDGLYEMIEALKKEVEEV